MSHALLSPSGASKWMRCHGSLALEQGEPDTSSIYADEGTAAHDLGARCLATGTNASEYLGQSIAVADNVFVVDFEMADNVQKYVDNVRETIEGYLLAGAVDVELRVEQRVDFSDAIGQPDAFGTADVQLIVTWADSTVTIHTVDLKYGRGVKVDADENEQMMLYNVGLAEEISLVADIRGAVQTIHQPRLGHLSEWHCTFDWLEAFKVRVREAAAKAIRLVEVGASVEDLSPGDKQCRWCKAKATCPALRAHVLSTVADDFVDETRELVPQLDGCIPRVQASDNSHLAMCMNAVDLIESWCEAVRAKVASELFAGREVSGHKLVQGRRGARAWESKDAAEATLKSMRLKESEMYDWTLISPTTAEKLSKAGTLGPKQWAKLQALIVQPDGKPSVAPASDKRPALVIAPALDGFEDETADDLV